MLELKNGFLCNGILLDLGSLPPLLSYATPLLVQSQSTPKSLRLPDYKSLQSSLQVWETPPWRTRRHPDPIPLETENLRHISELFLSLWRWCLRKRWCTRSPAPLSLQWTVLGTARRSSTTGDSRNAAAAGKDARAGRTERIPTVPLPGREARSSATAATTARSLWRTCRRSASWRTCASVRGLSLWTRRSRLCAKSSPRYPRTNSARYRLSSWPPGTLISSVRFCRATSWTPRCPAAVMWRTRDSVTRFPCGEWRARGPCQHHTNARTRASDAAWYAMHFKMMAFRMIGYIKFTSQKYLDTCLKKLLEVYV